MQEHDKINIDYLQHLCQFVSDWSNESDHNEDHINNLLLEMDLTIHQVCTHANKANDEELLQYCIGLQDNLELLEDDSPSSEQIELLCAWPTKVSEFLENRGDSDIEENLRNFVSDSYWPALNDNQEIDLSDFPPPTDEVISIDVEESDSVIQEPDLSDTKPEPTSGIEQPEYTAEQQELLDLLNTEIVEIQESCTEQLADIDQLRDKPESLMELAETQIDQVERIGSAAEMIGLQGLNQFCIQIQKFLSLVKDNDPNLLITLNEQLLEWPDIVQAYLFSPQDEEYIQAAIDYLSQDSWPIAMSSDELSQIEAAFSGSVVEIDTSEIPQRLRVATTENVSLNIPPDVQEELVTSLLLDLPKQTEEFSEAVQNLRNKNFLDQLERAKRIAHTLKGAGNTVGIQGIANLTHQLEDILEALLKAEMKPSVTLYDAIQSAADCIEEMSEYLQGTGPEPSNSIEVFQEILNWANNIDANGVTGEIESETETKEPPTTIRESEKADTQQDEEAAKSTDVFAGPTLRVSAFIVDELLKRAGENTVSNAQIQDQLMRQREHVKLLQANNRRIKALVQELEHLIEIRGFSSRFDPNSALGKFDPLEMDQFNEIHTLINQLMESSADVSEVSNNIEESHLELDKLSIIQARNLRENQDAVLQTRMIPVESIAPRLKRSVRQACKLSNKQVNLDILGENTLIDSEFLNRLVDPLMHILRNAVDHGIETPDYREKQGKNPQGNIQLSFMKEGNHIYVECQDDGRGLDLELIQSKAIEKGFLQKGKEFTESDAIQMILQHGFSTKDEVSQLSGRGVGLDVVFANVGEMKGSIKLDSNFGQGLKVSLSIPTSFHSTHALIASCDGKPLAIANRGIQEILYPGAGAVVSVSGEPYYQHKRKQYPLIDLQTLLYEKPIAATDVANQVTLIISDDFNKQHAVMFERIYDTRDIVIKPLSRFIPSVAGLLGTTISGDGSITTVIDIIELMKSKDTHKKSEVPHTTSESESKSQPRVLIVEDAISTRKSLELFMHDIGFEVDTAKDGVEAVDKLAKRTPTIVLTDLEMPRMNGLELTNHLRTNSNTKHIPIVMITSRATEKHKKEAERLGVSAYLTKPYNEDQLLNVVHKLSAAAA